MHSSSDAAHARCDIVSFVFPVRCNLVPDAPGLPRQKWCTECKLHTPCTPLAEHRRALGSINHQPASPRAASMYAVADGPRACHACRCVIRTLRANGLRSHGAWVTSVLLKDWVVDPEVRLARGAERGQRARMTEGPREGVGRKRLEPGSS